MGDQIFYSEGAGNSFFLTFSKDLKVEALKARAQQENLDPDGYICLRPLEQKLEEGADESGASLFKFVFYNKDEGEFDFCGNALRAVGLSYFKGFGEKKLRLQTQVGTFSIECLGENQVRAEMPAPQFLEAWEYQEEPVDYIMAGVPHLVFRRDSIEPETLRDFCENFRKQNLGGRQTYNLTFYKDDGASDFCGSSPEKAVPAVTFERGVEDFTLACGSGALSVFASLNSKKREDSKSAASFSSLYVRMPGGLLFLNQENLNYKMQGPAQVNQIYQNIEA